MALNETPTKGHTVKFMKPYAVTFGTSGPITSPFTYEELCGPNAKFNVRYVLALSFINRLIPTNAINKKGRWMLQVYPGWLTINYTLHHIGE